MSTQSTELDTIAVLKSVILAHVAKGGEVCPEELQSPYTSALIGDGSLERLLQLDSNIRQEANLRGMEGLKLPNPGRSPFERAYEMFTNAEFKTLQNTVSQLLESARVAKTTDPSQN